MEEIKKGNKNIHRSKWKWKHDNQKPMGFSKSSVKGKVHRNTSLPKGTREKSNNNLILHLNQLKRRRN